MNGLRPQKHRDGVLWVGGGGGGGGGVGGGDKKGGGGGVGGGGGGGGGAEPRQDAGRRGKPNRAYLCVNTANLRVTPKTKHQQEPDILHQPESKSLRRVGVVEVNPPSIVKAGA